MFDRGAGLDYSDARPSYFNLLNLELCVECSRVVDMAGIFQNSWRGAAAEADSIGEQQLKRTQSGGRNRGEQQPKWTQSGSS